MHTVIKYTILVIAVSFFISCEQDMKIRIEPNPPKIVLNAAVIAGQDVSVHVSKSCSIGDKERYFELSDALVDVYINDQYRGTMQPVDNPSDSLSVKGWHKLPGIKPREGDKLKLVANAPGFNTVSAETIFPAKTEIGSIDTVRLFEPNRKNGLQFYLRFNDRADERNYYRLAVNKVTEHRMKDSLIVTETFGVMPGTYIFPYYLLYGYYGRGNYEDYLYIDLVDPIFYPWGNNPLPEKVESYYSWGAFPDNLMNGKEYTLKSLINTYPLYSCKNDSVTSVVHYDIQLYSTSESYYEMMKAVWMFRFNGWDLESLREPLSAYSNVEGGYGVVSAYLLSSYRITMPFGDEVASTPFDDIQ